jgi:hypothetical protein
MPYNLATGTQKLLSMLCQTSGEATEVKGDVGRAAKSTYYEATNETDKIFRIKGIKDED